ncbi:MBL fold metallo-hydrolase [Kineosporia sp. J2-2]|uniref:MBL fold metallo-hydrolase n=1 Tax=Kineosporia corallincola TaxID=2835133 RepID=A0ABS5TQM8_9ACTN|nr:MBL fold metallo-hydrolase [Kineosporia corallincola]MBT0772029.1 MBL fold metallo-hydrolase [Kineosporia corallincola]
MLPEVSPRVGPGLTWLGHSTVVLDLDGARLLSDPLLLRHNWPLRRRGPRPDPRLWEKPDLVLLSHLHHDHAELGSLRLLPGVPVLTAPENAAWLRRRGVTAAAGGPGGGTAGSVASGAAGSSGDAAGSSGDAAGSSGDGTGLGPDGWFGVPGSKVRARLVRADHGHRPMPHRPNAANGHLVQTPDLTVYLAGDTSLYDEMADLPALAGGRIDLAVVPIGGWGPKLSGGHMDPDQAARACALIGARAAVPVHWGTLHAPVVGRYPAGWMDAGGENFARALRRHAPGCRPVVLEPGAGITIPG